MRKNLIYAMVLFFLGSCGKTVNIQDDHAGVKAKFIDPPMEYRSMPLWVWNNKMTKKIIEDQLTDFKARGIGGVFVHPRPGLITPYLSEEWFELFRHAVETGKKLGMQVWIYDENSYPSGFAGGHVPAQMPESAGKMIQQLVVDQLPDTSLDIIAVFRRDSSGFTDITPVYRTEGKKKGCYYVYHLIQSQPSPWYGGFTYVDIMQRKVTEKFLELTHEAYKKYAGEEFGKTIPGSFQDEAQVSPVWAENIVNYTPALFDEFQKRWGYDLKSKLPLLYEDEGNYKTVRYHFYRTILDLFIEGWAVPYSEYCVKNHLIFTGHYWEHEWPVPRIGPDNMAMEAYSGMPGIDILFNRFGNGWGGQFGLDRSVKEVRSVANQLGKKRVMSETYGGAGWELTFADQRRIADWEFVLGINFINQHLQYATIAGARKNDYPQSFSYHEPWWKEYRVLGDYLGRMSLVTSSGEQINDILIIEPTTSGWMKYNAGSFQKKIHSDSLPEVVRMAQHFHQFIRKLEMAQVEYDLGSERIIKDHGKVKEGKMIIGKRSYSLVVLPPFMECVDSSTYRLLEELMKQKGKVLCYQMPSYIEGYPSDGVARLARQYPHQWINESDTGNIEWFVKKTSEAITFSNLNGGLLYHHRRQLKDAQLLLLVNTHDSLPASGQVTMEGKGAECWDALTGEITPYPYETEKNKIKFNFSVPPKNSLLLCITRRKTDPVPVVRIKEINIQPATSLVITPEKPNILTLDYCDLVIGKKTEKNLYYYDAMTKAYKAHGWDYNPWDHAVQYKTTIVDRDTFSRGTGFEAIYHFRVEKDVPLNSLKAVVERPSIFKVFVNGKAVNPVPGLWFFDKDFALYNIGEYVKQGENILSVKVDPFTLHAEIQPVYILGDFMLTPLQKGFAIVPLQPMNIGSWDRQGMPFYPYGVQYSCQYNCGNLTGGRYIVRLPEWSGTVAAVTVNGNAAGCIFSPPYELDITSLIEPDNNSITVTVIGSLRNTFGPHHNHPEPGLVSPWSFRNGCEKGYPSGTDYSVLSYGLMKPFELLCRMNE